MTLFVSCPYLAAPFVALARVTYIFSSMSHACFLLTSKFNQLIHFTKMAHMDYGKKVIDLFSFLRFEAAGDSEADEFNRSNCLATLEMVCGVDIAADDDDAVSCTGNNICSREVAKRDCDLTHDLSSHDHDEGARRVEDGNSVGNGKPMQGDDSVSELSSTADSHDSRRSVDLNKKNISRKEEDRLFWESCLAR
ncbi:hypothetical protein Droror1_Dr00007913 [Drosera rotundifolia]